MKNNYYFLFLLILQLPVHAESSESYELNENCVVNILNRTIQVSKDGGWALPNVPSNMGKVRARATCTLPSGKTISGQSEYFTLITNQITNIDKIKFDDIEPIPNEINFKEGSELLIPVLKQMAVQ